MVVPKTQSWRLESQLQRPTSRVRVEPHRHQHHRLAIRPQQIQLLLLVRRMCRSS